MLHTQSQNGNLRDCQWKTYSSIYSKYDFSSKLIWNKSKIRLELEGSCLKQEDEAPSKNINIFGVNMSSSVHFDNKKKVLILGKGPAQGYDNAALTAEAQCSVKFSTSNRKCCLSLHCNESNSFLFVNGTKIHQFKADDSEIKNIPSV